MVYIKQNFCNKINFLKIHILCDYSLLSHGETHHGGVGIIESGQSVALGDLPEGRRGESYLPSYQKIPLKMQIGSITTKFLKK